MVSLKDRIEGGLWGLLVGDALGVPYEFHPAESIPAPGLIEMQPPPGFERTYPDVRPGTWSDDGAQALCLLATLLHCGEFDPDDFGRRLQNWRFLGYKAVDNVVFDVGITTQAVIRRLAGGTAALQAGERGRRSNGNGSLMRVLPLALWHQGSDAELVRLAMLQSMVTHAHPCSQLCCALYSLWARGLLEQRPNPLETAQEQLLSLVAGNSGLADELRDTILSAQTKAPSGTGYVVDCLWSAKAALEQPDYESAVRFAIALGNDTDTTACVTGGLAGIAHGAGEIPSRWREALREQETVMPMLDALLKLRGL